MTRIEFKKTNHIFLDNGIIALHRYLLPRQTEGVVTLDLQDDKLIIEGNDLPKILETVYYEMGKAVYDTATIEQLNNKGNIYFDRKTGEPHLFPKIKTYGFTELLTNNAQGVTSKEENTVKIEKLKKEDPLLAEKIAEEFKKQNIKLLSKIYFDEPYTKITRLIPFENAHIEKGNKYCYLTGEGFKKLVDAQNITPFFSGLDNFNSNLSLTDKKVSWKVMYLSRFAAAQCLYAYTNRVFDSISVFFFGASSLKKLSDIYEKHIEKSIRYSQSPILREAWQLDKFVKNFGLYDIKDSFCGKDEYQFMILYTIFRNIIQKTIDEEKFSEDDLFFAIEDSDFGSTETPYIVSLRADAFASTMRPNNFETITHLKYLLSLFSYLESVKFDASAMATFLQSLKILKPSLKGKQDSFQQERTTRNRILQKILTMQPIIEDVEQIFYDSYIYLISNSQVGFKNFKVLKNFVELYESKVNIKKMTKELQKKAIDLGYSIGSRMIEYEGNNRQSNARQSRKYIIDVRNSRTFADFLDALNRISSRFSIGFKHEFAEQVDEDNFRVFKSFLTLGMFNAINPILQPKKEEVTK